MTWSLSGKYPTIFDNPVVGEEARKLFNDANKLLDQLAENKKLTPKGSLDYSQLIALMMISKYIPQNPVIQWHC